MSVWFIGLKPIIAILLFFGLNLAIYGTKYDIYPVDTYKSVAGGFEYV